MSKSLITEAAREAVMGEAGESVSPITNTDRIGPTLLLDAVEPDTVRFVKRYCEWLSRGLVADSYIAARFDRSFQRLRRLGKKSDLVRNRKDMPAHWEGPALSIDMIKSELSKWYKDDRLTEDERKVAGIMSQRM